MSPYGRTPLVVALCLLAPAPGCRRSSPPPPDGRPSAAPVAPAVAPLSAGVADGPLARAAPAGSGAPGGGPAAGSPGASASGGAPPPSASNAGAWAVASASGERAWPAGARVERAPVASDFRRDAAARALPGGGRVVPREAYRSLGPHCHYLAIFPEFEGLAAPEAQGALNRALTPPAPPGPDSFDCEGAAASQPFQIEYGYRVVSAKRPGALSVELRKYDFAGGAHGTYAQTCEVLDLRRGERRALREWLAPGAGPKLSALATAKLRAEHGVADLTAAGFFKSEVTAGDAPDVCLLDDAVALRFAPYEVAPYAMGAPEVTLSFAELRPLLKGDPRVDELLR